MKIIYPTIILILLLIACNRTIKQNIAKNPTLTTFQQLAWLEGNWARQTSRGAMHESWTRLNDSTLQGVSYVIRDADTVSYEQIALEARQNNIFYIPTVRNQNENKPVSFTLQPIENDTFIFENLQHDFPQRILYWQQHPDSLHAAIEGLQQGKKRRSLFVMTKKRP